MLLSTASVTGSSHVRPGQPGKLNNQDAIAMRTHGTTRVIVLADGCGSQPHSEIGADIGANLAANMIMKQLKKEKTVNWDSLATDLCEQLVPFIEVFDGSFDDALLERFMFTLIAVVIHKNVVTVSAFGDGIVIVDDEVLTIEAPVKNTPPYFGYLFRNESPYHEKNLSEYLQFRTICEKRLQDIKKSLIVATDGLQSVPLEEIHHPGLMAKPNALQFWLNSHAIEHAEGDKIVSGICSDDATIVMIRTEEAQAFLVKGRAGIVRLKKHLKAFLDDELSQTLDNWEYNPITKVKTDKVLEDFDNYKKELHNMTISLDAVLDCQYLTRQIDEKLMKLRAIEPKTEFILQRLPKFPFGKSDYKSEWWRASFKDDSDDLKKPSKNKESL